MTNNSWGGGGDSSLRAAIDTNGATGQLFTRATAGADGVGDDNDPVATFLANYDLPSVISVAATDHHDQARPALELRSTVDLAALGVSIASTYPGNQST